MAENKDANKAENKDVSKAKNGNVKNEKNQPSNTPSEPDGNQGGNQNGNQNDLKGLTGWLSRVRENAPRIATSASGVILGFIAAWKGFGQWWFGFQLSTWVLIVIAVAFNIVWLTAVCGYLAGLEKNKPKLPRSNTVFMIALPALVLGILFGYFAISWRLADKIVILVEPFDCLGQVQDGNDSGKDLVGIAETIKSELDRAILKQDKRLDVRVVLGKRHEQELSEEALLEEHALKYRADMVISGWYVERVVDQNKEFLVCPKFQVVRVPKPLPAVFRGRSSVYPETIVFSGKEIENLNMNFTLKFAKQLTYEPTLVLGAGAYASGDWKTAQQLFADALSIIEDTNSPENGSKKNAEPPEKDSEAKKRGESRVRHEHIEGDKALLHLYIGHCLMHRSQYENAILRYDDAIEAGKKIPISDMRYGEILASAYLARGVAYRQVNAFELARQDFETAGGHFPTSLGLRPLRAEKVRFLSGDRAKLEEGAEEYRIRGEEYLIQREYKHAQAYLEMSVEFYRRLMKGMPTPFQEKYSLRLAESLIRLGEIHNRLAKPELIHDEVTWQAIEHLDEGVRLTRRFGNQEDPNMLKIRADGLRHLGEAYRAMDDIEEVEKALKYHQEAKKIWKDTVPINSEGIANEWGRIGDVHRRLCDIDPTETNYNKRLSKAEQAYYNAALELGTTCVNDKKDNSYIRTLNSCDSNEIDPNPVLTKIERDITAHHMAWSLSNLAQTHFERYLSANNKYKADPKTNPEPNETDVIIAEKCLRFAVTCYKKAVNKLEKDEKWKEKINRKERNHSIKDDLSWCQTLHGYARLKKTTMSKNDSLGKDKVYKEIVDELKEAKEEYEKLGYADQGHVVLNLFALTASQVELGKKQEAQQTLLYACNKLRDLTREKKKVWYVDYVYDIMENLAKRDFKFGTDDDSGNLEKIETWLTAGTVREGRQALDKIIKSVENRLKKSGEADG